MQCIRVHFVFSTLMQLPEYDVNDSQFGIGDIYCGELCKLHHYKIAFAMLWGVLFMTIH